MPAALYLFFFVVLGLALGARVEDDREGSVEVKPSNVKTGVSCREECSCNEATPVCQLECKSGKPDCEIKKPKGSWDSFWSKVVCKCEHKWICGNDRDFCKSRCNGITWRVVGEMDECK
eukprot:gb/GFBE01004354.1/.p1 GENE.gb/GFBE01004354.1/~~gb/GFBE01004354.1/.p1  ORF type:complete len:119 (+),score=23.42 gb/GFBE01004354.1/:1-357(+)